MSVPTPQEDFRKKSTITEAELSVALNPLGLTNPAEVAERFFGPNALDASIAERGQAYIAAARLIIENSAAPSSWRDTERPMFQAMFPEESTEKARDPKAIYYAHLEKTAAAWLQCFESGRTEPIEHHHVVTHLATAQKAQSEKTVLLNVLLGELCEQIRPLINDPNADTDTLLKHLNNAENHTNWKTRAPVTTKVDIKPNIVQVRIDEPITEFTQDQQEAWKKILAQKEKDRPRWFRKLAPWEQKHFTTIVAKWAAQTEPRENLGTLMGTPPTTIRGYPGARNAYKSAIITYKKDPKTKELRKISHVTKIRSGHISPSKMKSIKERQQAAQDNVEQLIIAGIQQRLEKDSTQTDFLIDLQTLITPFIVPADNEMDLDRLHAIDKLRKKFRDPEKLKAFFNDNFAKENIKNPKITLITSNYPVNEVRVLVNLLAPLKIIPGISHLVELPTLVKTLINAPPKEKFTSFMKWLFSIETYRGIKRAFENSNALRVIEKRIAQREREIEAQENVPEDVKNDIKMARDALNKIKAISGPIQRIRNFITRGINHNAERAALEQIAVSGCGAIRIGSCMSGKDREEEVSEHATAMASFYANEGMLPPIPPAKTKLTDEYKNRNKKVTGTNEEHITLLRTKYESRVADAFLSGHGQKIAAQNAAGANGLKSSDTVLGKSISEQAQQNLSERHPDDAAAEHYRTTKPTKTGERNAKLNRAKASTVEQAYQANMPKTLVSEEVSPPAQVTPPSIQEKTSPPAQIRQFHLRRKKDKRHFPLDLDPADNQKPEAPNSNGAAPRDIL